MSLARFTSCFLLATLVLVAGCATPKLNPDPLEGWKLCTSQEISHIDKTITDDYRNYIQNLLSKKSDFIVENNFWWFEDEAGQHAIMFKIPYNGVWLEHVLIYDKDNKRIKVIKYSGGKYRY